MQEETKIVSVNGKILPSSKVCIPVTNLEFSYGFGVYETIKLRNRVLYFLPRHIDRLFGSAEEIILKHNFTKKQLSKYIIDLVKAEKRESINIKVLMIGAPNPDEVNFYVIPLAPLFPPKKLYKKGAKLITAYYERMYPNAKTLNMMASYIAFRHAQENDCYDSLFINRKGQITEGTRTNFYFIKGKTIYSAKPADILLGVTRDTVLESIQEKGYKFIEKNIFEKDFAKYDGAFITSTSTKIMPVKEIILSKEKKSFVYPEIYPEIKQLMKIYKAYLDNYASSQKPL